MVGSRQYLTLTEVATRFDVHPSTFRRWWLSNKTCLKAWCPDHRIGKVGLRFLIASVEEFEKSGQVNPDDYEGEKDMVDLAVTQIARNSNTPAGSKLKRVQRKEGAK